MTTETRSRSLAPLVLVVDDMSLYRKIAMDQLTKDGLRVSEAASGEDALLAAAAEVPDLVLLDMTMPGIDGVETCKRLKADTATKDVPIIFLSALDAVGQVIAGLEAGASDYVTKPFSPDELLARVRAHIRLKLLQDERALLYGLALALQGAQSLDDAYAVIASHVSNLLPEYAGIVFLTREAGDLLEPKAFWGELSEDVRQPFLAEQCFGLQSGTPYSILSEVETVCEHRSTHDFAPSLCVPLVMHGEALGLLYLRRTQPLDSSRDEPENQARQQLAATVAVHIALNLGNLQLRETLRGQSIRDSLTGLFNRRYLEESMIRELGRAGRDRYPVGLIMMDIDHFKRFNDTFGHDAGDAVLRAVGGALRNGIRTGDIACRYGGEEFIAILPGAGMDATCMRAEELRAKLHDLEIEYHGSTVGSISASFGIAVYPEHGDDCQSLIRAADAALYRSKQSGRDRISVAIPHTTSESDASRDAR